MARGNQYRLEKLTISLLKEDADRSTVFRSESDVTATKVKSLSTAQDSLYVKGTKPRPPRWRRYLGGHAEGGALDTLVTASSSAALLIDASDRLFAVTFGHGRHLLEPSSVVQDFGLKVVLNTVAPDQLKSVDTKTIDETTVHTRRDVSHDSSLATFGLDISRDLLRAVTGSPKDETLAHRLTGSDALGIHTRAQVPQLPELASRLLDIYGEETYKEHFDFVDHLRPVKRPGEISRLNDLLISDLANRELDDVHLAVPETIAWIDVEGFRFSTEPDGRESQNDPRISRYLDSLEEAVSLEILKASKLILERADGGPAHESWRIYDSLVYQVELDDSLYVLSTGDWFKVDLDYRDRVVSDVAAIPDLEGLPEADVGTDEATYNEKAAAAVDGLCLDSKLVQDAGPDSIEICDVLTRDGGMIHVKQRGSSSTLSHLFAQGLNSAQRLLLDAGFRERARAVIDAEDPSFTDTFPEERPSAADFEVTYAVITRSRRDTPLTVPFFSLVSLRAAADQLRAFGFKVSKAAVKESG